MAHPDFDKLLNALAPFAKQMLSEHGEFYPFGATMTLDGQVALHAGDVGSEHPETQAVIDLLTQAFREQVALVRFGRRGCAATFAPLLLDRLEHQTGAS